MILVWLFLYVAGLTHAIALYRVGFRLPVTWIILLPLFTLPLTIRWARRAPLPPWVQRLGGLLAFACAALMVRQLGLKAWPTEDLGLALLAAGLGLGSQVVAASRLDHRVSPCLWLWVGLWQLAGAWHPMYPWLGAGLGAALATSGWLPEEGDAPGGTLGPGTVFLLGLVLPKPWWDFDHVPHWAFVTGAWGLAAALGHLASLRPFSRKIPDRWLLVALAVLFICYPSRLAWIWGAGLGLMTGLLWPRLRRSLSLSQLTYALLAGLVLSYVLHSNLGVPGLRRLLWWGA
jgi:hypothetical protein